MDTLSHGLWAAVAAKAINKALRKRDSTKKLSVWIAGFWGTFPDFLSFTPLFFWTLTRICTGAFRFEDFASVNPTPFQATVITPLTSALYGFTHSVVAFVLVFLLVWFIIRRPIPGSSLKLRRVPWELGGWLLHLLMDIPTHPAASYPTPLLWPFAELHIGGISWATPAFLIVNYVVLGILFFLLREKGPRPAESLSPRQHAFRIVRNVAFAAFVVVVAFGTYAALRVRDNQIVITYDASPDMPVKEANLTIASPKPNETVGFPLIITGTGRVFENTFSYRVYDEDNALLYESNAMTDAPDAGIFGNYSVSIYYPAPEGTRGRIEVFEYSAKDGEEINKVTVPIVFNKNVETQTVNVYFSNRAEDPETMECNKTYPTPRRIPKTQAPARAALEELLKGPDRVEARRGFFTSINPGVRINSLIITNGIAKVDFDALMEIGMGGSCRVSAVRSEITNTLMQFPSVQEVVIGVEGRVEDALQP